MNRLFQLFLVLAVDHAAVDQFLDLIEIERPKILRQAVDGVGEFLLWPVPWFHTVVGECVEAGIRHHIQLAIGCEHIYRPYSCHSPLRFDYGR